MRLAPGVMLTNQGGTGHPNQIFLRGFDAREGQDIEFTVDGIPINEVGNPHGNGLADTHFIVPELVQSLRVIEGPYAPQQGNFAVAGSALFDLGLKDVGLSAKATLGSFNTKRMLLLWRPAGSSDHTFGGAELFSSDGFGENRASQRATAQAGYETQVGSNATLRLLASSYVTQYAQAGLLRDDDVRAGRKDFYGTNDTAQGGDTSRHSLGATLQAKDADTRYMQSAFATYRDSSIRQNFTGFLQDPQQTWQRAHAQRGDLIDQQATAVTVGGRGSVRHKFDAIGQSQELELGYFARLDSISSAQRRNRTGTNIPYRTDLSLDSALTNLGIYADVSVKPLKWISLRGGVRADFFHYRVRNRCAITTQASIGGDLPDTECFSSDRTGYRSPDELATTASSVLQPRAVALFGPFSGFTIGLSYGRGARSLDPQYVNPSAKTPFADVRALEAGVTWQRSVKNVDIIAKSTFFQTRVDKDLFFNETEGRNTLANGTTRTGYAAYVRATGTFFDLASSLTLVRATFDDTGLAFPYAPGVVVRVDGTVFGDLPLNIAGRAIEGSFGTGISVVGPRPLPFNEQSDRQLLIDVAASAKWKSISLGVTCTNLINRQYRVGEFNYTSNFRGRDFPTLAPARHFNAGEPRAIFATFAVALAPKSETR
jgi:iron complex outermembrane recepter protein